MDVESCGKKLNVLVRLVHGPPAPGADCQANLRFEPEVVAPVLVKLKATPLQTDAGPKMAPAATAPVHAGPSVVSS